MATASLIFVTQRNLEMLQLSQVWLTDGTFKTTPTLVALMYVLRALRGGPDPMKDGHSRPDVMLKCYFFHLSQNLWRKVQAKGIQAEYNMHGALAIRIRLLPALAFDEPSHVRQLFTEVAAQLPMPLAAGLLAYFEDTYIGRLLPSGTYQEALFPIDLWNYHIKTPFALPRTTNAVETWHRSYNSTVGSHHPNIWGFIIALKREQGLVDICRPEPPTYRGYAVLHSHLKGLISIKIHYSRLNKLKHS